METNAGAINADANIVLYCYKSDGNGSQMTITISSNYVIKSVVVTYVTSYASTCSINGTSYSISTDSPTSEVQFSDGVQSVILKNVHTGSNVQVRISSIEITYEAA